MSISSVLKSIFWVSVVAVVAALIGIWQERGAALDAQAQRLANSQETVTEMQAQLQAAAGALRTQTEANKAQKENHDQEMQRAVAFAQRSSSLAAAYERVQRTLEEQRGAEANFDLSSPASAQQLAAQAATCRELFAASTSAYVGVAEQAEQLKDQVMGWQGFYQNQVKPEEAVK